MGFIKDNRNPLNILVDDCVIRAISAVTNKSWDEVYLGLMIEGYTEKDMPNGNVIWGNYLLDRYFTRYHIPDSCPLCYTVRQFAEDHPTGRYVVSDGRHAVAVINGDYIDTWDSGDRTVLFYFRKDW